MILVCACGWTGVPTYGGGAFTQLPGPWVYTPTGRTEQRPGKKAGSAASSRCPACRSDVKRD